MRGIKVFFVLISVLFLSISCNKRKQGEEYKVEFESKEEIITKKSDQNVKFKLIYPIFKDYPELNKIIEQKILKEKKNINENMNDLERYDIWFKDVRTSGKYIGFMFTNDSYYKGAAHGMMSITAVNYDTEEKKEVNLKDVFSPLSKKYLEIFSEFSLQELTNRVEKGEFESNYDFISEGTDIKEENFNCFNLRGSEVIVVFNQYQVAPYSSGISEVTIPLNSFK